jgi:hypothetical protein
VSMAAWIFESSSGAWRRRSRPVRRSRAWSAACSRRARRPSARARGLGPMRKSARSSWTFVSKTPAAIHRWACWWTAARGGRSWGINRRGDRSARRAQGVEHVAQVVGALGGGLSDQRQVGRREGPFLVAHLVRVRLSIRHPRMMSPQPPQFITRSSYYLLEDQASSTTSESGLPTQMRRQPCSSSSSSSAKARSWSISPSRHFCLQVVQVPLRQL